MSVVKLHEEFSLITYTSKYFTRGKYETPSLAPSIAIWSMLPACFIRLFIALNKCTVSISQLCGGTVLIIHRF
jgi:hypothetical protein